MPKLCLLIGFFGAAFLGWSFIRCVPWLAREGALSFRVTFATFASTGVVGTRDFFDACLHENEERNWLLRCPTRKAEDAILSRRRQSADLADAKCRSDWYYAATAALLRPAQKRCRDHYADALDTLDVRTLQTLMRTQLCQRYGLDQAKRVVY